MERQTIYLLSVNDFIFLVELERHVTLFQTDNFLIWITTISIVSGCLEDKKSEEKKLMFFGLSKNVVMFIGSVSNRGS